MNLYDQLPRSQVNEVFHISLNKKLNRPCPDWGGVVPPVQTLGAIHSTKIPTGPTGKRGPPQKVDPFFRNFSGWTEPIRWVLDRNLRKVWLNGSRPLIHSLTSHFRHPNHVTRYLASFSVRVPVVDSNEELHLAWPQTEVFITKCLWKGSYISPGIIVI